jgi:hypothetical protein
MMNGKVYAVLAFVIGLAFGLSFSLTVRPVPEVDTKCETAMATLQTSLDKLPPTRTPHVCPPLPDPCPTILYKALPDAKGILSTLGLVDYELSLVDAKLENYITSKEGEYDWALVSYLSLLRSAHNYLLEAEEEITYWYILGELTCTDTSDAFEICANHSTCRSCMGTFVGNTAENDKARHCINQMMSGR